MSPENEDDRYSKRRRRLYQIAYDQCAKQYINYHKFYTASRAMEYWSIVLKYFTAVLGAILLAILSRLWPEPQFNRVGILVVLSVLIAGGALINSIENWDTKSHIYHNYGQRHQELFEEFRKLVRLKIPDTDEEYEDLEDETYELLEEKESLSKLTPQISSIWYRIFQREINLNRDPSSIEDVRDGKWNLRERDE